MKPASIFGIILIVLGIIVLAYGGFSFKEDKKGRKAWADRNRSYRDPQRAFSPDPGWPRHPPGECVNLRLFHDAMPGAIKGRCAMLGVTIRVYEAQWTLDPNGTGWSDPIAFPNSRSFKFSGLERGKDVWVRVRALNSKGPGPWSDPVGIMVV